MSYAVGVPVNGEPARAAAWWLHCGAMLLLLVLVVWRLVLPALRDENFGIVADPERGGWTSDFAAHLTFAKAFWHGRAGYDVDSHLRITSERSGRPVEHALPFGYSPTMLWVLGPLCVLPDAWAYVGWTLLGVAAVWWMTRPPRSIWLIVAFFTPTAFSCLKLGQTALLTTAGLLFLMAREVKTPPAGRVGAHTQSSWSDAIVLWALTAKPPLALVAGTVLLIGRRWRTIAHACGLGLLSTAILTPLLGISWVREYLDLMTHYDVESANPAYVWSLVPETMGNLRALLHVTLGIGDSIASRLSGSVWLLALASIVGAGLCRRLPIEACWGLAVLVYLLFCPHVTAMEELQLVLVLTLFVHPKLPVANAVRWTAIGMTLLALYLAAGLGYRGSIRLPAVFADKVLLAGLISFTLPGRQQGSKRPEAT